MYQESDDKLRGTKVSDAVILIALIVLFFAISAIAAALRAKFNSPIPMYVAGAFTALMLYIVYRLRLVGWRYTIFYKDPEPEYDPRFDEEIVHEDYPYPVGTVVIERTVSAKGEILAVIDKSEIECFLEPGAEYSCDDEQVFGPCKKERSSSLVVMHEGKKTRYYFTPTEEFKGYLKTVMES